MALEGEGSEALDSNEGRLLGAANTTLGGTLCFKNPT
jgi:hypothetical protein